MHGTPTIEVTIPRQAGLHLYKAGVTQLCGTHINHLADTVIRIDESSPRVAEVLQALTQHGIEEYDQRRSVLSERGLYSRRRIRVFAPEQIASAELVMWDGITSEYIMAAGEKRTDGRLVIATGDTEGRWSFAKTKSAQQLWACGPYLLASRAAREHLESAGFTGLSFLEVLLAVPLDDEYELDEDSLPDEDDSSHEIVRCEPGEEIYEVTSDLFLPPMARSLVVRRDWTGADRPLDCGNFPLCNPHFHDLQPVYHRTHLRTLPPFDAALALERRGHDLYTDANPLILSQRLARKLLELTPQMIFRPVAILPD